MNEENNFSFMNNENNENTDINSQPQPVSQDIFNSSPTPSIESEPAPVENLNAEPSFDNILPTDAPAEVIQPVEMQVEQPVQEFNQNIEPNTVVEETIQPASDFNQQYGEMQNTFEPVNNTEKKKINPILFVIIGAVVLLVIAGIFLLKGCSTGYGKKSSKYPNRYNNTMYYKVSDSEIYEIKYYENKDAFVAKDSYTKYLDRRIYYPEVYKNVGYFEVDLKFVNEDTLTKECAKASSCGNAYEEYTDTLSGYEGSYLSNSDDGVNTKKINGREYKYFVGTVVRNEDHTYHYVVYQTKITDKVYYVLTYYGGEDLTEETLQGFLNIKVNKLKSTNEIKNFSNYEWY